MKSFFCMFMFSEQNHPIIGHSREILDPSQIGHEYKYHHVDYRLALTCKLGHVFVC